MSGVFEAFQRGVETSRQRRFQDEARVEDQAERTYRDSRRAKLDPMQDQLLANNVSESDYQVGTQDLRRDQLQAGVRGALAGASTAEFNLAQAPKIAGQRDTAFATQQEQAGLNMELARSQEGRAAAQHGVSLANARRQGRVLDLQFDAARAEGERVKALQEWSRERHTVFQLAQRNPEQAVARLNELYAKNVTDGNDDAGVRWDGRQFVVLTPDGTRVQQELGDAMGLLSFADMYLSNPDVFAKSVEGQIAAAQAKSRDEAAAREKQLDRDSQNFRATTTAAGTVASMLPGTDDPATRVVTIRDQLMRGAPGRDPGAPEPVSPPPAVVAQALEEIPARHINELLRAAADPEDAAAAIAEFNDPAAFGGKYGPGIAEAILQRYAASRQQMANGGER